MVRNNIVLLIAVTVCIAVALLVAIRLLQAGTLDAAEQNPQGPATQPVSADFLRNSDLGRQILSYLTCIDFECAEIKKRIESHGSGAQGPLLSLLRHGVPSELAAEVPGDISLRALDALESVADGRALPELLITLKDGNPLVRAAAVRVLGRIEKDESVAALERALQDRDALVREATALAFARLGRPETVPALLSAAGIEREPHVRKAMEEAIRTIERKKR